MMKLYRLTDMIKGWFIGAFHPTVLSINTFECGVKRYHAGDYEPSHHHRVATEYTVIVSGEVEMNGIRYGQDDIIVINPGTSTDFRCLTDVVTVVVKHPGAANDKYLD